MTHTDITRLFRYTEWANHLILDASEKLTPEQLHQDFHTGQHSVLETFVHIFGAESVWLERWMGNSPTSLPTVDSIVKTAGGSPLAQVQAVWNDLEERRRVLLGSLSEDALQKPLSYKNTLGEAFSQPLIDQMHHVANHGTHHRGQIAGFLRSLGITPPITDLIYYFRTIE